MEPDRPAQSAAAIVEAAWPQERRRAFVGLVRAAIGRVALFVLALAAMSEVVRLLFGTVVPREFFAFMGGLALMAAVHGEERGHLSRQPAASSRSSRGCYPPGGVD